MSRIIVKNLPTGITDEDFKKHFSECGTITDAKIRYRNGESRKFGFIGFKTPEEAAKACKFKDTYFKHCKITVELSTDVNPEAKPQKYKKSDPAKISPLDEKIKEKDAPVPKKYGDLFTIVIRSSSMSQNKERFTKKSIKTFLKPLKYLSLRIPRNISYVAYVGFKTEKEMKQAMLKNQSFINGVRVRIHKYEKSLGVNGAGTDERWGAAQEKLADADPVGESGKLFVRNLWYSATQEDLEKLFGEIGTLCDVTIPLCKATRKSKGIAHVTYMFPNHAVEAMEKLDGTTFQGRTLHILPSIIKEEDLEEATFKEKSQKEKKKNSSWHNWNALFLGPSAVIDLVSESLGQTKQTILNNEGQQSAAVTLALGEAKIVDETKKFLISEGICLESFSKADVQRSSTVLLVKHLPAHTKAFEIKDIFGKHGELGRVVLPPSGVTAIVEFLDPSEAKLAYSALAYTRFKHLPLYLEWAPMQTFNTEAQAQPILKVNDSKNDIRTTSSSSTTLYVKNLNFKTDEDKLQKHFSTVGDIYTVRIAKKRMLSQGYGFVQYIKASDAKKALVSLQESILDGHNLSLKFSDKNFMPETKYDHGQIGEDRTAPVILVKNIPFDSPLTEIRDLFKVFGKLSAVRLPRHLDNQQHRGFCFVEFLYKQSAENAFEALKTSTHLRGRILGLQWSKENKDVNELRKRTADRFLSSDTFRKRQKVDFNEDEEKTESY